MSTPPPAPLVAWPWWRDLAERLGRQALQTAVPILLAVQAAAGHVALSATLITLGGAEAITIAKAVLQAVAGVTPPANATLVVLIVDRAVPAFAGVLLGFLPASWFGLLSMHWQDDLTAAVSAAVLAVVAAYVTPPAAPIVKKLAAARTALYAPRVQGTGGFGR